MGRHSSVSEPLCRAALVRASRAMRYAAVWEDRRDADRYIHALQRQSGQFENLFKKLGTVELKCLVCKRPVATILVARELIEV